MTFPGFGVTLATQKTSCWLIMWSCEAESGSMQRMLWSWGRAWSIMLIMVFLKRLEFQLLTELAGLILSRLNEALWNHAAEAVALELS